MLKKVAFYLLFFATLSSNAKNEKSKQNNYKVDFCITNNKVSVKVMFTPGSDFFISNSLKFRLDKSYKNIKITGNSLAKKSIENLEDKTVINLSVQDKLESISFTYDTGLDELTNEVGDSLGFMLLDEKIIPMIESNLKFDLFTFEVNLKNKNVDFSNFFINGTTTKKNHLISNCPTDRILMLFSKNKFVKTNIENTKLNIYTTGEIDNKRLTFIKSKASEITSFYNVYFCKNQIDSLDIIVNKYHNYSFFSRPNFMSLQDIEFERGIMYLLAHELAHNWFCNALIYNYSPDAFMNESFAEYSAYLYNRNANGEDVFSELIERKKREFKDFNYSVNNISFDLDPTIREKILYTKGALICYELENHIGRDKFKDLMCEIVTNKTSTLNDFEKILLDKFGKKTLEFFKSML